MIQKIITLGAKIMTSYIPDDIVQELNDYVDETIKNEELTKSLDHGKRLAGDITQEIELPNSFLEKSKWPEYLGDRTAEYIRDGLVFKKFLWEIFGVPNRSECKFHAANYWKQLNGCIALGDNHIDINKDGDPDVTNSRNTMYEFDNVLKGQDELELQIL